MSIALVQSLSGTNSPASYTSAVTANSLLVMTMRIGSTGATPTISDSVNGSWTLAYSQQQTGDGHTLYVFYFAGSAAGSPSITITNPGGGTVRWITEEFSGVATSSPVRGTPVSAQGAAPLSSGPIAAVIGDLVLGSVTNNNSGAATWLYGGDTPGGNWSIDVVFAGGNGLAATQHAVATVAGNFASNPQSGGSANCTSGCVVFKPASGGGGPALGVTRIETVYVLGNGATPQVTTVPFATPTTAGELILVLTQCGSGGAASGSITDNLGQTYTARMQQLNLQSHVAWTLWECANSAAGVTTVTYTAGGADTTGGAVATHYTGLLAAPFGQVSNGGVPTEQVSATSFFSDTITTTAAALLVGIFYGYNSAGDMSSDSPFTVAGRIQGGGIAWDGNNGQVMALMDSQDLAAQAGVNVTGTIIGSATPLFSGIVSYYPAVAPSVLPPRDILLEAGSGYVMTEQQQFVRTE